MSEPRPLDRAFEFETVDDDVVGGRTALEWVNMAGSLGGVTARPSRSVG